MLKGRRTYTEGQEYNCLCGCGSFITISTRHKYDGVPRFIKGHDKKKNNLELINSGEKECPKCVTIKSTFSFYKDKTRIGGYRAWCKDCCGVSGKLYRKSNPEKCTNHRINWRKNNPERTKELNNIWAKNNPKKVRDKSKRYRLKHPTKQKETDLKYKYGLTLEDYDILVDKHKGHCGICGTHETEIISKRTKLCIDHDHSTGKVRGLLCHSCNKLLGNAKDNQQVLLNAIKYLINNEEILDVT